MKTWQQLKANPELFSRYFVKEQMLRATREFFWKRNYHELESPILTDALPQERYLNFLSVKLGEHDVYLAPSTERFNKIMLAAGLGEHFVITKVFRGMEQIGPNHSPEFTMLEWYHLDADYKDIMMDTELLVKAMLRKIRNVEHLKQNKSECAQEAPDVFAEYYKVNYQGIEIDFGGRWLRKSVRELLRENLNLELEEILALEDTRKVCREKGVANDVENLTWHDCFDLLFFNFIESNLDPHRPTFIYDYPKVLGPLTKVSSQDPEVCEKVELYIAGKEIANGYTEQLDGDLQRQRFEEERTARAEMGLPLARFDDEIVNALKSGLPDVAGIGMGLDRLAMILADARNIAEVNFFPASEWELDK